MLKKILSVTVSVGIILSVFIFEWDKVKAVTYKMALASAMLNCFQVYPQKLNKTSSKDTLSNDLKDEEKKESSDVSIPQPSENNQNSDAGEIKTQMLSLETANTVLENLHISNKTGVVPDYEGLLSSGLPFKIAVSAEPQVLIVHTHATEAYASSDSGSYDINNDETRSTDNTKNTVRVGAVLAKVLNDGGIGAINDETQHDYPAYTGSYSRSEETILSYLEKYPTIKLVIDLHRDSISAGDNAKLKPTCEVEGKKAAQIMLLAGCETGDITDFPNWKENLRTNLVLQKQIETDYSQLCRPLCFKECKYNFDVCNGSILIEVGSEANTLEEAEYSAELIGKSLLKILNP